MLVTDLSVPALLKERADQQADTTAYTYIDYGLDPNGFAETLTWSQVHRRACVIAEELKLCGSPGDRVAILAPQGLEYIIAFLGRCRPDLSRFRFRRRNMAFTTIAFPRYCGIPSRSPFSRLPLSWAR